MKILMLYTTNEGQTLKIMQRIQSKLQIGNNCEIVELTKETKVDFNTYDCFIFGSPIRYGFYSKTMRDFLNNNCEILKTKTTAFFGVNLVARKPHKNTPQTNVYTRKFLEKLSLKPNLIAVFAGALTYPKYKLVDKYMIKFIMWMAKGETDTSKEFVEYTDWKKVDTFSNEIIRYIKKDDIRKILSL